MNMYNKSLTCVVILIVICLHFKYSSPLVLNSEIPKFSNDKSFLLNKNVAKKFVEPDSLSNLYGKDSASIKNSLSFIKANLTSAKKLPKPISKSDCPTCTSSYKRSSQLQEEANKQRLEYIKQQILHKLGMSRAPRVEKNNIDASSYLQLLETSTLNRPSSKTQLSSSSEESDKLFVFASSDNPLGFNFPISNPTQPIKKIILMVKQQRFQSFFPFLDGIFSSRNDQEATLISTSRDSALYEAESKRVVGVVTPFVDLDNGESTDVGASDWLQYEVTELLSNEIRKRQVISIESESFDIKNAFFVIEFDYGNIQRNKRSVDCTAGNSSSCCRESFYVNFTHIGWDNWILQPLGYHANYCKGKCDISHARYHHTTVIGKYPSLISLCCSPREMSHISLIYVDDQGYVFQKNLPNMVVESCDCA